MKQFYLLLIIFLVIVSCVSTRELREKSYKYKSKKRTLTLSFENDSVCKLINTFHCNDIDPNIKELTITCEYSRKGDTIFLRNTNCQNDDCVFDSFFTLPPQKSEDCSFLESQKDFEMKQFMPNYMNDFHKYGLVPNIDIDTLYVIKNKILLYKKAENFFRVFYFK